MAEIPEFTDAKVKLIRAALKERCGRDIPTALADAAKITSLLVA